MVSRATVIEAMKNEETERERETLRCARMSRREITGGRSRGDTLQVFDQVAFDVEVAFVV
jgi:hypothetical protein